MEYYTSLEVANLLGITKRAVNNMCKQGRIAGAQMDGYRWRIPKLSMSIDLENEACNLEKDERPLGIGKQNFESLRTTNCFYIDKTLFIKEWWEQQADVTLITRPRRFGKSLNLSMMECFFSNRYVNRHELFQGLNIWDFPEYRRLQGTFPVVPLSFAKLKELNFENAYMCLCQIIRDVYLEYEELFTGDVVSKQDRFIYQETLEALCRYSQSSTISNSINALCRLLSRYYGKKAIILLDEYDTPMQEAFIGGYWEEMSTFMRAFFNATFKSNPYIEKGLITGITRTSKESIFSDLNNLDVVTTLSSQYVTDFGFTEQEVFLAMDQRGIGSIANKKKVKEWYDGFTFGSYEDIYNPWSIIQFFHKQEVRNYWANTSSNALISELICKASPRLKESFQDLIDGSAIRCEVEDQVVFSKLETNENAIWSLLVASGYLKAEQLEVKGNITCNLRITNREVQSMFEGMVRGWFEQESYGYNGFIEAMLGNNVEAMNAYMNKVAVATFSVFDVASGKASTCEPERFYHGFVLGLLVELRDRYEVRSNRESGYGRYDVMMIPHKLSMPAYILEFKVHNSKKEESLEETVQSALKQIEDRQYEQELLELGFDEGQIYKYGFAFEGKQVLIA